MHRSVKETIAVQLSDMFFPIVSLIPAQPVMPTFSLPPLHSSPPAPATFFQKVQRVFNTLLSSFVRTYPAPSNPSNPSFVVPSSAPANDDAYGLIHVGGLSDLLQHSEITNTITEAIKLRYNNMDSTLIKDHHHGLCLRLRIF